jgi:hypothetical protein
MKSPAIAGIAERANAGLAPAHDLTAAVAVAVRRWAISVVELPADLTFGVALLHRNLLPQEWASHRGDAHFGVGTWEGRLAISHFLAAALAA